MQPLRFLRSALALFVGLVPSALAQCDPDWGSANGRPDLGGNGLCSTAWDPDGAGPAVARLVVGGTNLIGGTATQNGKVATYDGTQWTMLGTGPGTAGEVRALTVWNGQLIAGGTFNGGGTDRVAAWNGTSWQSLGTGAPTVVSALAVWNNLLVAAGYLSPGSLPSVRTWDGSTWTPLPTPPNVQFPSAAIAYQGWLCIGGHQSIGSQVRGVLERWNGSTWSTSVTATDAPTQFGTITCFSVRGSIAIGGTDTLYVGGRFTSIGGVNANSLASTSGGTAFNWSPVDSNIATHCVAVNARPVGLTGWTVTAAFSDGGDLVRQLTNSSAWTTLGVTNSTPTALAFYGGSYHCMRSAPVGCMRWDGSAWTPTIGVGLVGEVRALASSGNDIVVGGTFTSTTATTPLARIARWNGATFTPLDTGISGTSVDTLARRSNGDVIAGGSFTMAGSTSAANIARWTGATWAGFGTGTNDQVLAVCELPNGDLVAGGKFTMAGGVNCNRIARWNGTAWSSLNFGFNGDVRALAVKTDGTLFAAGSFTSASATSCNRIARWDGFVWQPLGTGCNGDVHALAFRPNGDLVVVGAFSNAGGVPADRCAIWNGASWTATGSSSGDATPARSAFVLPNGDLVVGRGFHQPGVTPDAGIARWNGTTWSGFDSGVASATPNTSVNVRAIVQRSDGTLVVGGDFGLASGLVASGLATLTSACPASASTFGTGCSSTAGQLSITADTLPWIGTTFRTTTTGVASNSVSIAILGLAAVSVPLGAILTEGQPGCSLLASLDIALLQTNGPGNTATSSFTFTNDPALIGVPFFQQTIPFEFDLTGAVVAVRGSNALSLVIGTF